MEGMIHPDLKTFLMGLHKVLKFLFAFLIFIPISGCQHQLINSKTKEFNVIEFNPKISSSFKSKSKKYLVQVSDMGHPKLIIHNLDYQKKNLFSGSSARPTQIEILGKLNYEVTTLEGSQRGIISVNTQLPSNEPNPQAEISAQNKLINELEFLLLERLVQELHLIGN